MERQIIKDKYLQSSSQFSEGFPGDTVVKNPPVNVEDMGLIPDLRRSHMPCSQAPVPQVLPVL